MQSRPLSNSPILNRLKDFPVIAAVHSQEDIDAALCSRANILFLMRGDIFSLERSIRAIHESGRQLFAHFDLVKGLSRDDIGVRYYATRTLVDGLISTNASIVKLTRAAGLYSILRIFIVDSQAFENSVNTIHSVSPSLVEVMPALIPPVITELKSRVNVPLITGGMVSCQAHVDSAISAGAMGVSTSLHALWNERRDQ